MNERMAIPEKDTLIKYQKLLNSERPSGTFVNIDWGKGDVDYYINKMMGKWLHRYIFNAPNTSKFRSIIRKVKLTQ